MKSADDPSTSAEPGRSWPRLPLYVRVVLMYAFFSAAYILITSILIFEPAKGTGRTMNLANLRSFSYIAVTSIIIFILLRNSEIKQRRNEELEKIHIAQMAQADKLITLGTLVSGVAHEINNPINFITLNLPLIREFWQGAKPILEDEYARSGDYPVGRLKYSVFRERVDMMLDGIGEGAERIKGIVSTLKDFARPDPSDMTQRVDLNASVEAAARLLRPAISRSTERFVLELDPAVPPLVGSAQKLEQIAINLIQNALDSLPTNQAAVVVSTRHYPVRKAVAFEVRDEGSGIDPKILPRITDPFFTTKRGAGGMGLGLAIVSQIVHDHGGTMDFSSRPGAGTRVSIEFPEPRGDEGGR